MRQQALYIIDPIDNDVKRKIKIKNKVSVEEGALITFCKFWNTTLKKKHYFGLIQKENLSVQTLKPRKTTV
jgi:hypothetical protein